MLRVLDGVFAAVDYGAVEIEPKDKRGEWKQPPAKESYAESIVGWGGERQLVIASSGMQSGVVSIVILDIHIDSPIQVLQFSGRWEDRAYYELIKATIERLIG